MHDKARLNWNNALLATVLESMPPENLSWQKKKEKIFGSKPHSFYGLHPHHEAPDF
jgi:hypothetical protein|uniref:Uncharacterized protein n=1 Tax=Zea mays TaxID=4577 RepID=C4J074_MAIZE|nr:unknown [Zea mays]